MIELKSNTKNVQIKYPSYEGADGGYYKPSYSDEGLLEWTPSQADMPPVEPMLVMGKDGAKGDTGDSGVHVGDSEPTNGATVWIVPNELPSYIMTEDQVKAYIDSALEEVENGTY